MNVDVTMPQLGETVAEGTVIRWLRKVGDQVGDQEPLLEISTDKVDTEVPSPAAGTLLRILVEEDTTVPVGAVLAVLGAAGDSSGGRADLPHRRATSGRRHEHSPRVRRLASEAGLALSALAGTGPAGRVTPQDVLRAASATQPDPASAQRAAAPSTADSTTARHSPVTAPAATLGSGDRSEPMSPLRSVVAERMMTSLHTSAQLTSVVEVDVTAVVNLRHEAAPLLLERLGVRLTLTAFFAKAALEALRAHPLLNASVDADGRTVLHHAQQHLGIAVDTDKGLMVPVVKDAGDLNLLGLSRRIGLLAQRARDGSLTPDDLAGGTFTLTNTGSRGALWDTPILVPGQVGILATGAVVERPVVVRHRDGERAIAIRSMAHLALTYDHRLVDGADAARFLTAVKTRLEAGQFDSELS